MKTVKEVSELTGISVRTLHYYDEIGILTPTAYNDSGYRLYDDNALETLQMILFFKEFDLSLNDIKCAISDPKFDKEKILISQKNILQKKRERLDGLLRLIDDILKGDNNMSFKEFSREEIEDMFQTMISNMDQSQLEVVKKSYGNLEHFKDQFVANAGREEAQGNFKKVVEWYHGKAAAIDAAKNPNSNEVFRSYQNRISEIYKKLALLKGESTASFEVKKLIGEFEFVYKQLFQIKEIKPLLLDIAEEFMENADIIKVNDLRYGEGASSFIGEAIIGFYNNK